MTFDRNKVIDPLCDNLEQWIGWEGYFSDYLADLKRDVENECKDNFSTFYKFEEEQVACRLTAEKYSCNYQFFYPVESPKLTGDKCAKQYDRDLVNGRKYYKRCYELRRGGSDCEDYKEKPSRRGHRKPDVEALVYNSLHYLTLVMAAVAVVVLFVALIVFAHKAA